MTKIKGFGIRRGSKVFLFFTNLLNLQELGLALISFD